MKWQIITAIEGTGNIVESSEQVVAQALTKAIKDGQTVGLTLTGAISSVAGGAIRGVSHIGADLGHATKGIMIGVLRGSKEAGESSLETISHTAHIAIRDIAKIGGDVEVGTRGLIEGAIQCAKEACLRTEEAVSAVVEGALNASNQYGTMTSQAVRKAVARHGSKERRTRTAKAAGGKAVPSVRIQSVRKVPKSLSGSATRVPAGHGYGTKKRK